MSVAQGQVSWPEHSCPAPGCLLSRLCPPALPSGPCISCTCDPEGEGRGQPERGQFKGQGVQPKLATEHRAEGSHRSGRAAAALPVGGWRCRQCPAELWTVPSQRLKGLVFTGPQPAHGAEIGAHMLSGSVLSAGGGAPASRVSYLVSLASGPSFEDVGGGPPLLRSLALASEASAGAQSGVAG